MPQIQLSRNAPQFQPRISGGTIARSPWPDVLSTGRCLHVGGGGGEAGGGGGEGGGGGGEGGLRTWRLTLDRALLGMRCSTTDWAACALILGSSSRSSREGRRMCSTHEKISYF